MTDFLNLIIGGIMNVFVRIFTALVVCMGFLTTTAGSASAYYRINCIGPSPCKTIGTVGGVGRMYSDGEIFSVQDIKKDGYPVVLQYGMSSSTKRATLWNTKGYTKVAHRNDSFPEGVKMKFRVCRGVSSTKDFFGCSAWAYLRA